MSTYRAIASTETDADSPITQTLMDALAANPVAIAEADATARSAGVLLYSGWQIEDGSGGSDPIYDHSSDGTVASFETPNFSNGYEYRLVFESLSSSQGSDELEVELFRGTAGSYASAMTTEGVITTSDLGGVIEIYYPRLVSAVHVVGGFISESGANATYSGATLNAAAPFVGAVTHTTAQKIRKARVSWNLGNIDGGVVYLLKRGEYLTP